MGEIIIRYVQLPRRVKAVTATDENGDYNIYVNSLYNCDSQQKAIRHELVHIDGGHFHRPTDAASDEKEAEASSVKAELCHSERSEESPAHKGKTLPHSICDTSRSVTAQYDRVSVKVELCHSEAQRAEESHPYKSRTLHQYSPPCVSEEPEWCFALRNRPSASLRGQREEGAIEDGGRVVQPLTKSEPHPAGICDTSRSATAQYDRVSEKVELCHSEHSEESHTHKSRTLPHSICDTSQSATAQYDSTRVLLCHSERSEESHPHKSRTLTASICNTSQQAAQYDRVSEKSPQRTTVKVSRANIVPRPDFEKLRRRAGVSTAQAAKLAGISHTEYIKYECGLAPCPPLTAKAITAALTGRTQKPVKRTKL